eukprot:364743-Chlamydomonas_euryale.AAC.6
MAAWDRGFRGMNVTSVAIVARARTFELAMSKSPVPYEPGLRHCVIAPPIPVERETGDGGRCHCDTRRCWSHFQTAAS